MEEYLDGPCRAPIKVPLQIIDRAIPIFPDVFLIAEFFEKALATEAIGCCPTYWFGWSCFRSQGLSKEIPRREKHLERAVSLDQGFGGHLYRNATRTIKIFLHLSHDEQRKRLLERIDEPEKNWKISLADIHERKYWGDYMKAYEECLEATSTRHAPWYAVPADDKEMPGIVFSDRPRCAPGAEDGISQDDS